MLPLLPQSSRWCQTHTYALLCTFALLCIVAAIYSGTPAAVSENRSQQAVPEESGADGTQSNESSADSKGSLVVPPIQSDLMEYQVPEILSALQTKHPRLFGGEVSGTLLHALQRVIAERSEQRELELLESRQENRQLTEKLTTTRIENSALNEKLRSLRDRAKMTEVVIAAGGILFATGLTWATGNPSSLGPWGVSIVGLVLLICGFIPSRRSR